MNNFENNLEYNQYAFLEAITQKASQAKLDFMSNSYSLTQATTRFNIYRHNIFENLKNALRLTFPGVWKLVGEECANSVAQAFVQKQDNWPATGSLDDWGEKFPDFLATLPELASLDYLKDYGVYEWLCHVCYCAKDIKDIETNSRDKLANIPETQIEYIKFNFIPACYLYYSDFDIEQIERVVLDPIIEKIDLRQDGAYGIIVKTDFEVKTHWLIKADWLFIQKLDQGLTLGEAAAYCIEKKPEFNLTQAIIKLLNINIIQDIFNLGQLSQK